MNDQLQQALTDLIKGIDTAGGVLVGELPEVIRQLLWWHGVYNFILFVGGILLLVAIIYGNYRHFKWARANWDDLDEYAPLFILHLAQAIWLIPLGHCLQLQWLQIWIAPKTWLLEYAAGLIK